MVNKKIVGHISPFPPLYDDISLVFFGLNMVGMRKMTEWEKKLTSGKYRKASWVDAKGLPYENPHKK